MSAVAQRRHNAMQDLKNHLAAWSGRHPHEASLARWLGWVLVALVAYSGLILIYGQSPLESFSQIWSNTLTSEYGLQDVLVRMTPLLFTALAVAVPARIGQVNIGGEGQLYMGGLTSVWVALQFPSWPAWVLLPAIAVAGIVGGGVWGGLAGFLKARGWLSEIFSTMLMNYIAILAVSALVFGPWRDPTSSNYPQTRMIPSAAMLPHLGSTRVDVSLLVALALIAALYWFLKRTRYGLEIRAIGGNPYAALRNGVPVSAYIVVCMFIGGALAGLAGMGQLSALQYRLNPGLSANFGYLGFLVSWMSGHDPRLIAPTAFLLAVLASSGDILQITQGLPSGIVTVMSAVLMLIVLLGRARRSQQ
jgi:general nucleoside transport system permease protein